MTTRCICGKGWVRGSYDVCIACRYRKAHPAKPMRASARKTSTGYAAVIIHVVDRDRERTETLGSDRYYDDDGIEQYGIRATRFTERPDAVAYAERVILARTEREVS